MWRQWWAFVFQKMWDFLNSWATASFWSGSLCHGVSSCVCIVSLAGWLDNKVLEGGGRKYCCLISIQSRHMPGRMEWICEECHDGVCVCVCFAHACCYIILLGIPPETKQTTFLISQLLFCQKRLSWSYCYLMAQVNHRWPFWTASACSMLWVNSIEE